MDHNGGGGGFAMSTVLLPHVVRAEVGDLVCVCVKETVTDHSVFVIRLTYFQEVKYCSLAGVSGKTGRKPKRSK